MTLADRLHALDPPARSAALLALPRGTGAMHPLDGGEPVLADVLPWLGTHVLSPALDEMERGAAKEVLGACEAGLRVASVAGMSGEKRDEALEEVTGADRADAVMMMSPADAVSCVEYMSGRAREGMASHLEGGVRAGMQKAELMCVLTRGQQWEAFKAMIAVEKVAAMRWVRPKTLASMLMEPPTGWAEAREELLGSLPADVCAAALVQIEEDGVRGASMCAMKVGRSVA